MSENQLLDKLVSIATDGAACMASKKNGVIGKFLKIRPYIIHTHCICHRLALGVGNLVKNNPKLLSINKIIYSICSYFTNSYKRIQVLKLVEKTENIPELGLIKPIDMRWLSNFKALERICLIYPALITALQEVNVEEIDPFCSGTIEELTKFETIAMIFILTDCLEPVNCLMISFQKRDIDLNYINNDYNIANSQLELFTNGTLGYIKLL